MIFPSLNTRRLQEAERRYCELEKEMERLKGEMQDWRAPKETGKGSTPLLSHNAIIFIIIIIIHLYSLLFLSVSLYVVCSYAMTPYQYHFETVKTTVMEWNSIYDNGSI